MECLKLRITHFTMAGKRTCWWEGESPVMEFEPYLRKRSGAMPVAAHRIDPSREKRGALGAHMHPYVQTKHTNPEAEETDSRDPQWGTMLAMRAVLQSSCSRRHACCAPALSRFAFALPGAPLPTSLRLDGT